MRPCPKCQHRPVRDDEWACRECRSRIAAEPPKTGRENWVTTPGQTVGGLMMICGFGLLLLSPEGWFLGGNLTVVGCVILVSSGRTK